MSNHYNDMNTGFPEESGLNEARLDVGNEEKPECVVRSNNVRALVTHFALSIIGFASLFILGALEGVMGFPAWLIMVIPIVGGSLIYIACGYAFLRITQENAWQSVRWLIILIAIPSTLGVIGAAVSVALGVPDGGPAQTLLALPLASLIVLNVLGFGIASTMGSSADSFYEAIFMATILLTAALPPGLLYIGLRLKIWRSGRNAGYTEVGDEMGEMRTVAVVESPSCSASE